MTIEIFEVGGCVRDEILGIPSKDVDFVVVAPSFETMRDHLVDAGFKIYIEKPEFTTIRCCVPQDHPLRRRTKDADFVLARKDGTYSDGRRPDFVEPGTLQDDLERRDFTVNALARSVSGDIIDPFGGLYDIQTKTLKFVGEPMDRINEDGLRVMRGLRFMVTKGFEPHYDTWDALLSEQAAKMLGKVAIERVREELEKMFAKDTRRSLDLLSKMWPHTLDAIFRDGLRLSATLKE